MKAQEAIEKLKEAFKNFDDEKWKEFLKFCAKFHSYSWNNRILIYYQRPDATLLKGYRAWQQVGRQVRKGERGIAIFAPMTRKEVKDGKERQVVSGFRIVKVFDISQTDGEPLDIPVLFTGIKGEVPQAYIDTLLHNAPIRIEIAAEWITHGSYDPKEKRIMIRQDNTKHMFKTMLHELGHYYHHQSGWEEESREQAEFLAESVACAVANMCGIDTSEYSVMYLKDWLDDYDQFEKLQKIIAKVINSVYGLCQFEMEESA